MDDKDQVQIEEKWLSGAGSVDLTVDQMCKPLYDALMGVWKVKYATTIKLQSPMTDVLLINQYMNTMLGETILMDVETGKVKDCPGSEDLGSKEDLFEQWTDDVLRESLVRRQKSEAAQAPAADDEKDEDEPEKGKEASAAMKDGDGTARTDDEKPVNEPQTKLKTFS